MLYQKMVCYGPALLIGLIFPFINYFSHLLSALSSFVSTFPSQSLITLTGCTSFPAQSLWLANWYKSFSPSPECPASHTWSCLTLSSSLKYHLTSLNIAPNQFPLPLSLAMMHCTYCRARLYIVLVAVRASAFKHKISDDCELLLR